MDWIFWTLVILPLPVGCILTLVTMGNFNNWAVMWAGPFWAMCWFGAVCLWVGNKVIGGG